MKVVIAGGVAGGATAAARLRRLDEEAEIVVFERSGHISYANCGLPYYIGGVIEDPEALTLQTPESFFARFRVDMRVRHEVTALHPDRKTVSVKSLETGEEWEESYDKLILSPGASPTQPPAPRRWDREGLYTAHRGGHLPYQGLYQCPSPKIRRAGRRGLHQPGAGGESEGVGDGGHHCPASKAADESL